VYLASFSYGYCSLAEKVASVLGCVVISMENYRSSGTDDGNDLDSIDFNALVRNLQVLFHFRSFGLISLITSVIPIFESGLCVALD